MTEYLLTPERRDQIVNLLNHDQDTFHLAQEAVDIACQEQLTECEEKAKPVWQRESVEMVFERIDEFLLGGWVSKDTCKHIRQEILDNTK